jgi:site-specific DNA-methyltransferase (adenine-specific)
LGAKRIDSAGFMEKERAAKNRTLTVSERERASLKERILFPAGGGLRPEQIVNKTICADLSGIIDLLPAEFADLLIIDPPYNLDKDFHGLKFSGTNDEAYLDYLKSWFPGIMNTLKPSGSVYICGDWKSTFCLYRIMRDFTVIRNRIVWQREKGRGAEADEEKRE